MKGRRKLAFKVGTESVAASTSGEFRVNTYPWIQVDRLGGQSRHGFRSTRDMSTMQGPDEGDQRAHLPQTAEVEVPEVR
jgi:hypothetical protein